MGENRGVHRKLFYLLPLLILLMATLKLSAQGTAFMYQGRLSDNGNAANGSYDLRFALYDAVTNGHAISVPQTNFSVPVASGVFMTNIDFGPAFTGTNYWLSIGVRTNGNIGAFTLLWPRQPLLPVPYAIFANSASNLLGSLPAAQLSGLIPATQLSGTLPSAQVSGNYFGSVNFTNSTNLFIGTFIGNGLNVTNLNGSAITVGTVPDARLSLNVALLNRNQDFTSTNTFDGPNTFNGVNTFNGPGTYTGINNFSHVSNSFSGSFFGNGLVGWIPVSITATNATRDHGYMLVSTHLTTVTLPTMASLLPTDIVRVSGFGPGGWLITPNAGESIVGNFSTYRASYTINLAGGNYNGVASAADGVRLYAVGAGITGIVGSTDSGRTFNPFSNLSGSWSSIACSANGYVIYVINSVGTVEKSVNAGATWTVLPSSSGYISCTADGSKYFTGNIACSGDGTYFANSTSSAISISTNGSTYAFTIPVPAANLSCLGVSSDCSHLVAGVNNGLLYATANQGMTWTALTTTNQAWTGAWMSPDGSRFAAAATGFSGSVNYYGVSSLPNTTATNGISGTPGTAVELQYNGSGQFMPVSSSGLIWAN